MTLNILFAADNFRWKAYEEPLKAALNQAGLKGHIAQEFPPELVDYIIYAPNSSLQDFTPYKRAKAVLNLWAGVEDVVGNTTLKIPLARMVDHGMTQGMVEWVTGHVLRHHLGMDRYITQKPKNWRRHVPPLAGQRRVCILGLGALGQACAEACSNLGFDVSGWSRSKKTLDGIETFHGTDGLKEALQRAQIVVLLLPSTAATQNLLDAERLSWLPKGGVIINPGRGPLIDDRALVAALDSGHLDHATLDVFRIEPLPQDHPFWTNPRITITPHIASETREETASEVIIENIRRGETGEPLLHLVDRALGY